jgi:uncharacterized protein
MNSKHGLTKGTVAQIARVLEQFATVERAVLFGSRAKGVHRPGSDIDLALVGDRLDWRELGRIDDALDDLLLPYRFSLVVYGKKLAPEVAAHIQRVGLLLFERDREMAEQTE